MSIDWTHLEVHQIKLIVYSTEHVAMKLLTWDTFNGSDKTVGFHVGGMVLIVIHIKHVFHC